jgi:hypothetical protein
MASPTTDLTLASAQIGVDDFHRVLHNSAEHREAALALFRQGKRNAFIYSRDLDPRVFDDIQISNALSDLARYSRYSTVQVLIADIEDVAARGHRWLELFQRLSSRIEVRVIHDDFRQNPFVFTVIDETALLYRSNANEFEGTVDFNDRHSCAQKLIYFREVWNLSRAASELRRLYL